jgi:S1-C subfamily serine protease
VRVPKRCWSVGVKDGSPAADAGLLVGDLLLALDDVALASPED